jgi:hypothetical protein
LWPIAVAFKQDWLIEEMAGMIKFRDMADLMIIYGIGACSVFIVLMVMYRYALSKSNELELNRIEIFDTKAKIKTNLLMASIPLISVCVAIIFYTGRNVDRRRRALLSEIEVETKGVSQD